jgi:hypothetical protein
LCKDQAAFYKKSDDASGDRAIFTKFLRRSHQSIRGFYATP